MGLLDRLRGQPAWQHPDASVRAAAIQELPDEDQDQLSDLARQDADASVRRAAVKRLRAVEPLAEIARDDGDEHVRAEARAAVLRLARDGTDEPTVAAAVAALTDTRDLADIAKSATLESASRAALARITEVKALSAVARRSAHPAVRREALARIDAPEELASVALRSEDKDIGLSALERALEMRTDDREFLASLSVRAGNRVVARRARAILRGLGEPGEPEEIPTPETLREDRLRLCVEVEALARASDPAELRATLDDVRARWAALAEDEEAVAPDAGSDRFDAACQAAERQCAALEAAQAAEAEQAEQDQVLRSRADLSALVDTLDGADALERLKQAQQMWTELPPLGEDDPQATVITQQFTAAAEACRSRFERWQAAQVAGAEFERLLNEAGEAVELPDPREARARLATVEQAWTELARTGHPAQELDARFSSTRGRLRSRERAERERERQAHVARMTTLCDRLETLARSDRVTLREADGGVREARSTLHELGALPRRERDQIASRLRSVQSALAMRVRELRDLKDWQRWANLGVQEELCAEVEALKSLNDMPQLARRLRSLLDRWKQASVTPKKEQADALLRRFTTAYEEAHARCEKYFAKQATLQAANLTLKEALCARAEALTDSGDWVKTAQQFEKLQAEWKAVGPLPHHQTSQVWKRFRDACDRFYTRRKADLARRKAEWAKNLERKEDLCTRAEGLAESSDWEQAVAEVRRLQADWKTIGPVKRNRSEAVWKRFQSACERFFERYHQRDRLAHAAKVAEREEILGDLAALVGDGSEAPGNLLERVTLARTRWQQAPPLPFPEESRQARRFAAALEKVIDVHAPHLVGTDLDPSASARRMEKLCAKVEGLLPGDGFDDPEASPAEVLARRWREALAAKQLGVKVDEEAQWHAAADEVKQAQGAWLRLWPVPGEAGRRLTERFERACKRVLDRRPRARRTPSPAARVK